MRGSVGFWNVRRGFLAQKSANLSTLSTHSHDFEVHCDSSSHSGGIGIIHGPNKYSIFYEFEEPMLSLSINFKELYIVTVAYMLLVIIKKVNAISGQSKAVFLIDNACAENICLTRRAAAKKNTYLSQMELISKNIMNRQHPWEMQANIFFVNFRKFSFERAVNRQPGFRPEDS